MNTTRWPRTAVASALCVLALACVATAGTAAAAPGGEVTADGGQESDRNLTLDASFAVDEWPTSDVTVPATHNPLTLRANRDAYTVTVTSSRLDSDALLDVLGYELTRDDPVVENLTAINASAVRMRVLDREATVAANLSDRVRGGYTFTFAPEGGATATASTTVSPCRCVGAGFLGPDDDRDAFAAPTSGVAVLPVALRNTDSVRLRVEGHGLRFTADVTDGNDDGRVTLLLNTHVLGRSGGFDDHALPYWTRQGVGVRDPGDTVGRVNVLETPRHNAPLPTGEYELTLSSERETRATGSLTVTDASLAGVESYVGPPGALEAASAAELRPALGRDLVPVNDTVGNESALLFELESASLLGAFGSATARDDDATRHERAFLDLVTGRNRSAVLGTPVDFALDGPGNASLDLEATHRNGGLTVVPDRANETLYVGFRTDRLAVANGTAVGSGAAFAASLSVHDLTVDETVAFGNSTAPDEPSTPSSPTPDPDPGLDPVTDDPTSPTEDSGANLTTLAPLTESDPAADVPQTDTETGTTAGDGAGFSVVAAVAALVATLSFARRRQS